MLRPLAASGAIVTVSTCLCLAASAQEPDAWRYQCLGDEVVGSQICTTELAVFEEGEEYIVYFVHTNQGEPPLVVSGENDTISSANVKVDKNEMVSAASCEAGACFFETAESATLLDQFRKGFRATVTLRDAQNQILFEHELSLRGFSAALTAPN
jgi:hypothetical protein